MNSPTLMRVFAVILAVGFLLKGGPAMAGEHVPKNIRVCVQFIEMPHTSMTELLSGKALPGQVLHEKAMAMTKEGKAKLVGTSMIMAKSGMKATIETYCELIYPTEHGFQMLPLDPGPSLKFFPVDPSTPLPRPLPLFPTSYDVRNSGFRLDAEPTFDVSTNLIDLRFLPENVEFLNVWTIKEYRDKWGDASIRMPTFETWRTNTDLSLPPGRFDLAATITPKPTEPVPAALRKILVFVRCDVIAVGKP